MGLSDYEQYIHLHVQRHKILASNVANSETPNYKAKDLDFDKALNKEVKELAVTHENHITAGPGDPEGIVTKQGGEWKDGNNVELNEEIAKMSENRLMHEFYLARFSGYVKKFKQVIKTD